MEKPIEELNLGEKLAYWRKQSGMSQEEFGGAMGVTRKTQSNYEQGERLPDFTYLAALKARGFAIGWLFGDRYLSVDQATELTDDERVLVGHFRLASGEDKNVLKHMALVFSERASDQ